MEINVKCFKCGCVEGERTSTRTKGLTNAHIIYHHISYFPEKIVPCCLSCHREIHGRLRKSNACHLSVKDTKRLSTISSHKRCIQHIDFQETLGVHVRLRERIDYRKNTGVVTYSHFLEGTNKFNLMEVIL